MFAGLSPVSPTPIPFLNVSPGSSLSTRAPITTSTTSTPTTSRQPVLEELRSQAGIGHQIPIIIEEQFSATDDDAQQNLFVFAKDGRFKDTASSDVFLEDVFKRPNKKENFIADPAVINPPVLETKPVTPSFDPRKRQRVTEKPRVSAEKEETTGSLLDSSLDLTQRLKQLKETIRKTKESLTAQKSLLTSRQPTSKPRRKKVRVRGRKRVRIPVSRRPSVTKENLRLRKPQEEEKNSTTISILIEETPRSSGRGRGRGRQKIEIKPAGQNKIVKQEKSRGEKKAEAEAALETELEEKYGVSVVQGLLGVLTTAVSHPDKDRILHQLKGQLAAMNVDAVRKLQFGGSAPAPAPTPATTPATTAAPTAAPTAVKHSSGGETQTTPVPASRALGDNPSETDEDGLLGSELEKQLARVASLAGRFTDQKPLLPLLVGSERQIIKAKLPSQLELDSESVAPVFPVSVPDDIFVVMPEVTTASTPHKEEEEEEEIVATTLRNLFQTERVTKIKMSATTPVSVAEEVQYENVLDGVPDGEPGLTKNFFERVPFLPDSIR